MLALTTASGIVLVIGIVLVLMALGFGGMYLLHLGSRSSRGGVQPPPRDRGTRHNPPLESIEHRS